MQRPTNFASGLGLFTFLLWSAIVHAEPSIYPTGVTRYDPGKAYNIFVLFSGGDLKTHLIDMVGTEVHVWDQFGFPGGIIDPALIGGKRGHVILWLGIMTGSQTGAIPVCRWPTKTKCSGNWTGTARSFGNGATPRPAAGRNSTMTGAASPMAIRWCCPLWTVRSQASRYHGNSTM